MAPDEIRLAQDRRQLEIVWSDGARSRLTAHDLRANCRSAPALRSALDGVGTRMPADLRITSIQLVGRYAVNLVFSDGEDRGIYPWSYLRLLGDAGHQKLQERRS